MAYGVSLGVTTHLDQGAFQATNTPTDGAAHEDNYTMHLPFLAVLRATARGRPAAHQLPAPGRDPDAHHAERSG